MSEEKKLAAVTARYRQCLKKSGEMFLSDYSLPLPLETKSSALKLGVKIGDEFGKVKDLPPIRAPKKRKGAPAAAPSDAKSDSKIEELLEKLPEKKGDDAGAVVRYQAQKSDEKLSATQLLIYRQREERKKIIRPKWHAPWKLKRVQAGHLGWVRCAAVDVSNEWFVTGAGDRQIKIWDLASGDLKLTLTGHISTVMGVAISDRHPYLFSVGQDKLVKCWDLEQNKVTRHYHGHLSGVYSVALHPTLDVLVTGGRDSTARVWDMRTKAPIRVLGGHTQTVGAIQCQAADPQIITASHDSTMRLWDLAAGKCMNTLTHHKKSVRGLAIHPTEFTFASASTDNIKVWKCPEGTFLRNFKGHNTIINDLAINNDNVCVSGGDNGTMYLWDWKTGYNFQQIQAVAQPGSMENEAGVFATTFDRTGSRLITCEADKTVKIWEEDLDATEEDFPIDYRPPKKRQRY
jgi:pleiotropic regulator 1